MSSFWGIVTIFRRPFLERVAQGSHQSTILELAQHFAGFDPPSENLPLRDWFDFFYSLLLDRYQCEYIYKNILATRLYLGRHSLHNSVLTNEFRCGNSRADMAIINDTSTVYEVKSKFDDLSRLDGQLADYRRIFDRIFVVTTAAKVALILEKVDPLIGIMVLSDDGELIEIRDAQSNKSNTDPAAIFDCMRQAEYSSAIKQVYGYVPEVPNSQIYREARKLFCKLGSDQAHDLMVENVSMRGKSKAFIDLISDAPTSLKHTCLVFSKSQALALQIRERLGEPLLT